MKEISRYPNVKLLSADHAVTLPGSINKDGKEYVVEEYEFVFADITDWLLTEWLASHLQRWRPSMG